MRETWEGWTYVDTLSDGIAASVSCVTCRRVPESPVGVAAYDIGRLLGEGPVRTTHLTREGLRDGLESVKRLPASSGLEGTTVGLGITTTGHSRVRFFVLRRWENGRSVGESAESLASSSSQPDLINPM